MTNRAQPDFIDSSSLNPSTIPSLESSEVWSSTEGQIVNISWILLSMITFWLIAPLLWLWWKMYQTSCHTYTLSSERLKERSGAIVKDVHDLELYRVKDISVHQPFLQRLLGRGQVLLTTSDRSTPKVILNAISAPDSVADIIRHHVERCRVSKGVREID